MNSNKKRASPLIFFLPTSYQSLADQSRFTKQYCNHPLHQIEGRF